MGQLYLVNALLLAAAGVAAGGQASLELGVITHLRPGLAVDVPGAFQIDSLMAIGACHAAAAGGDNVQALLQLAEYRLPIPDRTGGVGFFRTVGQQGKVAGRKTRCLRVQMVYLSG